MWSLTAHHAPGNNIPELQARRPPAADLGTLIGAAASAAGPSPKATAFPLTGGDRKDLASCHLVEIDPLQTKDVVSDAPLQCSVANERAVALLKWPKRFGCRNCGTQFVQIARISGFFRCLHLEEIGVVELTAVWSHDSLAE